MSSAKLLNCCYADQYRFSRSKKEWSYSTSYQYKCLNIPGLPIANPGAATALNLAFFEAIQKPTKEFLTTLLSEDAFQGWAIHSIGHRKETSRSPMFRYHNSDYYDHHFEFEVIITKEILQTGVPVGPVGSVGSVGSVGLVYEALRMVQMQQGNNAGSQGRIVEEIEDIPSHVTPAT